MISVSANYNTIISNGGQYEWRIKSVVGNTTFYTYKEHLISGTITRTAFEKLSIGNTIAAQLDLELYDVNIDPTAIITMQFRATNGTSNSTWYSKGTFYIDTIETSPYTGITTITAFDAMLKAETPYQTTGEWQPALDTVVLQKIASDMGVTIDSNSLLVFSNDPIMLTASPNIGTDGTTDREILSYLAAMRGGNWYINYNGLLVLWVLSTTPADTAAVGDAVVDFDASPAETITKLKVWTDENTFYAYPPLPLQTHTPADITDHSNRAIYAFANSYIEGWEEITGRTIEVKIPFWCDYAEGNAIYNKLLNKSFVPYEANTTYLDPKYEVGDKITIKDVTSVIASNTTTLNQLSPCDVALQKEDIINSYYPYKSKVQRTMEYNIAQNTATLSEHASQIRENAQAIDEVPAEISKATTLITGGFGGYVKWTYLTDGTPSELLFMDSPDEGTAVNILRINRNGIGFSTDGGATYANAWTIDGQLNADFIKTGTITAIDITGSTITGGSLTSATANGSVRIADGSIDFYENATTTGAPFSQIKHIYDSEQGDSIEWSNNGYTKLVSSGGAQMSGNFVQFGLGPGNLQLLIYAGDDDTHTKIQSGITDVTGQLIANKTGYKGSSAIKVAHGTANQGAAVFVNRTDADRSISLAIGPNGIDRGIYVADANMDNWLMYYNDTNIVFTKPLAGLTTTLWTGTKVTSGTVSLSDSLANYTWLSFTFNTNVDKAYEFVRRADFDSGNLMKSWSAGSWNGSRFLYNTWVQLTKVDNTTIRVSNGYNDANWQGGLVAVYGFKL